MRYGHFQRLGHIDELQLIELLVSGRGVEQLIVGADGGDAAAFENGDAVGAANGRKPMRDHHHGAVLHQVGQRGLHQGFAFGIERRGGFVQNQDGRVLEDGARDGQALALAAGEPEALFADHRLVALRHVQDEVVRQRIARGLLHQ